jgi:hypothetical protein
MGKYKDFFERHAVTTLVVTVFTAFIIISGVGALIFHQIKAVKRDNLQVVIATSQRHLVLHPDVGYLWGKNLHVMFAEHERWLDTKAEGIDPEPITTDGEGFFNHPAAIREMKKRNPDIIGVGDSFMHDGAAVMYNAFAQKGIFYYSMAMHRHCPPQYNLILARYVIQYHPKHVIYGVYENDLPETIDFREWQKSGMDWFKFHSGTWCGPPITGVIQDYTPETMAAAGTDVLELIIEAAELCRTQGIDFSILLIPSKEYVVHRDRSSIVETSYYDYLQEEAIKRKIRVIDLRQEFARATNPSALYWKRDGHWSYQGMNAAVTAYLRSIHAGAECIN